MPTSPPADPTLAPPGSGSEAETGNLQAHLTDALARGRLVPAELAAISPPELEALFEHATARMEVGQEEEAVALLGALVALFPFAPKYWRAYGIALHRLLDLEKAARAYSASLVLDPGHNESLCYRGEIYLYLGRYEDARYDFLQAQIGAKASLKRRAKQLLEFLQRLLQNAPTQDSRPGPEVLSDDRTLTLGDGHTTLPLEISAFEEEDPEPLSQEITQTARVFAPVLNEERSASSDHVPLPLGEETAPNLTAPLSLDPVETAPLIPSPIEERAEDPALQYAELDDDTDLIPGRPKALAMEEQWSTQVLSPMDREATDTAVLRRRRGVPLVFENTLTYPEAAEVEEEPEPEAGGSP